MTEMPDAADALSPPPGTTSSEMFPVLTAGQQARVLAHGQRREVKQGEIVIELNELVTKVFVVVSGRLHALKVFNNQEQVVALCNPGMFTGELNVLSRSSDRVRWLTRRSAINFCLTMTLRLRDESARLSKQRLAFDDDG